MSWLLLLILTHAAPRLLQMFIHTGLEISIQAWHLFTHLCLALLELSLLCTAQGVAAVEPQIIVLRTATKVTVC